MKNIIKKYDVTYIVQEEGQDTIDWIRNTYKKYSKEGSRFILRISCLRMNELLLLLTRPENLNYLAYTLDLVKMKIEKTENDKEEIICYK